MHMIIYPKTDKKYRYTYKKKKTQQKLYFFKKNSLQEAKMLEISAMSLQGTNKGTKSQEPSLPAITTWKQTVRLHFTAVTDKSSSTSHSNVILMLIRALNEKQRFAKRLKMSGHVLYLIAKGLIFV